MSLKFPTKWPEMFCVVIKICHCCKWPYGYYNGDVHIEHITGICIAGWAIEVFALSSAIYVHNRSADADELDDLSNGWFLDDRK